MSECTLFNQIYTDTLTKFTNEDNLVKPLLHFVIVTLKNDKTELTDDKVMSYLKNVVKNRVLKSPDAVNCFIAGIVFKKYLKQQNIDKDDMNFFVDNIYEKIYSDLTVEEAVKLFF